MPSKKIKLFFELSTNKFLEITFVTFILNQSIFNLLQNMYIWIIFRMIWSIHSSKVKMAYMILFRIPLSIYDLVLIMLFKSFIII